MMLADVVSPLPEADFRDLGAEGALGDQVRLMSQALTSPQVGLVLLDLTLETRQLPRLRDTLAELPPHGREQSLIVAHVCGPIGSTEEDVDRLEALESSLRETGIILTPSNATAARLAAMILAAG